MLGEFHTKTATHLTNELASGQNWTNEFNYRKIAPKMQQKRHCTQLINSPLVDFDLG